MAKFPGKISEQGQEDVAIVHLAPGNVAEGHTEPITGTRALPGASGEHDAASASIREQVAALWFTQVRVAMQHLLLSLEAKAGAAAGFLLTSAAGEATSEPRARIEIVRVLLGQEPVWSEGDALHVGRTVGAFHEGFATLCDAYDSFERAGTSSAATELLRAVDTALASAAAWEPPRTLAGGRAGSGTRPRSR